MDIITRKPDANEQAMRRIYGMIQSVIPDNANQGTPQTTRPNSIAQIGVAAGNMNQAAVSGDRSIVSEPAPQASDIIPATGPDPNKLSYGNDSFRPIPGAGMVHSKTTNTSHILGYDKNGNVITKDLGQDFRTPAEIAAETRANATIQAANAKVKNPVIQKMIENLCLLS